MDAGARARTTASVLFGVLAILLAAVSGVGVVGAVAGVAVALVVSATVVFGAQRVGIGLLALAFGTAPMYRGLESLTGEVANLTDMLAVLGTVFLLPTALRLPLRLPPLFLVGIGLVVSFGLIAMAMSVTPVSHLFWLAQWTFYLGVLPGFLAWWRPSPRIIAGLLWCYLIGQSASTITALAEGSIGANRYDGLSHHPNAFGLGAMMSVAIILFLFHHHRTIGIRVLLMVMTAMAVTSGALSGSRAATLIIAALVLLIPIVERSGVVGIFFAVLAGLGVALLPAIVAIAGETSAISRLAGDASARNADLARSDALEEGLDRFFSSPLLGSGLQDVEIIHNTFLEAAVGIGVFGALGYLIVLFTLTRPIFSDLPLRRLSYLACAVVAVGPGLPGLWDPTIWVPTSVVGVLMVQYFGRSRDDDDRPVEDDATQAASTGPASS